MNIKTKIFFSILGMVFSTVLITTFSIMYIMDRSMGKQTETLIEDLRTQSCKRIISGNKVLHNYIENYIMVFKSTTSNLCRDEIISEGITKGQWKSIFARLESICKRTGIDFIVIFDAKGRFQISWPEQIDEELAEAHFNELEIFRSFGKYLDVHDLFDVPIFSSFEKWDTKIHKKYDSDIDDDAGIVILSAGIIPNDYFDEPVGYVLSGVTSVRLLPIFVNFSDATGYLSLFSHGENPLIWAGVNWGKDDIRKSLRSLDRNRIKNAPLDIYWMKLTDSGEKYHIHYNPLVNFSSPDISVGVSATDAAFVVGESYNVIFQSNEKNKNSKST